MLLKALILRPILRERLRTVLTLLGIAVGVAVIVAIDLSNESALRAFRESVDAVAGRANYQIASEAGIDENLLLALQPFWSRGVRFAPVIDIEGMLEPAQTPIRILGVDLFSDVHFRDYRYAKLLTPSVSEGTGRAGGANNTATSAPPANPAPSHALGMTGYLDLFTAGSVILPAPYAREHHLALGDPVTIDAAGHMRTLTLRGILEARGPATAFNGAIAILDIATAQESFGLVGRLTRIDLIVPEGDSSSPSGSSLRSSGHASRLGMTVADIARVLPANARIERPSRRNARVEKMLRAFRINLFALAGVALLVGMFLVYNTVLISILRRRRDVGIFKTLGVSPQQIFISFLGEGLVFGALGSALGIALGYALASSILGMIGRTINALYITSRPQAIALTPAIVAVGLTVGTTLSLLSALQPSIEAAGTRPNLMIRSGLQQGVTRYRSGVLAIAALACFIVCALAARMPPIDNVPVGGYASVLFVVAGFSLLAPLLIRAASALSEQPMRRTFGIVGQLAAASIPASLRRTSVACAALALATGMMVAVALMVGSFRETVRIWVNQTLRSDLWLRAARGLSNSDIALLPPAISDDLQRIPFIAAFDRVRGRDVTLGDDIIFVGSGDTEVMRRFGDLPMVTPDADTALRESIARDGVLVSESFSIKFRKHVGDFVELPVAKGLARFPITGIYRDYSNDRGVVFMDRPLYERMYDDHAINTVVLYLRKGVDPDVARRQLETMLGPKYHAFTVSNREIRVEVMKIFDQTFLITYALLAIAIVVAVLGIINTLAALILERSRELALLRVLGMSAAEVRRMLVLESSILGATSTITGLVMGYALSWILINVINKQSFGWTIGFHTPVRLIAAGLIVTFASAVVAGIVPARLANRIDMASAMKAE